MLITTPKTAQILITFVFANLSFIKLEGENKNINGSADIKIFELLDEIKQHFYQEITSD